MKVKIVTTWGASCGISEHSHYLVEAVQAADASIIHEPVTDLHPRAILESSSPCDLLVLNYQAALHSQWTPESIRQVRDRGTPVLCVYHDSGVPNSAQCLEVCAAADAVVIHEPCDDLPQAHYWRMGVPDWQYLLLFDRALDSWCGRRPVLGSIGFPFGWKCYDELARITGKIGWALLLIAPGATAAQIEQWRASNPHLLVHCTFVPRAEALSLLASCDATAFTYVCHNTGQSGAILQGIAARKPVIALSTCRQMRALYADPLGREAIRWCSTFEEVAFALRTCSIERCDPGIVALAEQESWQQLGKKYAALYAEVAGR